MEQEYIDRVENYLAGGLSDQDKKQFEKDLQNNPDLQRVYQEFTLAIDVIDQQLENELRSKFKEWQHVGEIKKTKIRKMPVYLSIAASFVLFIGVYFIFFYKTAALLTNEQLALEFYSMPDSPDKEMGNMEQQWSQGIDAYEQQDFAKAIEAWLPIKDSGTEVNYYLAHSYFNKGDYNLAIPLFKELSAGTSVYSYPSEWYLLLTYLAGDHKKDFNQLVSRITGDHNHPYYKDAFELSKQAEK